MNKFRVLMLDALDSLSVFLRAQFPRELKSALLEYGTELDRLRAEVNELRSKIEKE
jgi:hypothetical protein